jgi:phosphonate transport system ATP-binding protein
VFDGPSTQLTPALLRDLYGAEADEILALPDHISLLQERTDNVVPLHSQPSPATQAAQTG